MNNELRNRFEIEYNLKNFKEDFPIGRGFDIANRLFAINGEPFQDEKGVYQVELKNVHSNSIHYLSCDILSKRWVNKYAHNDEHYLKLLEELNFNTYNALALILEMQQIYFNILETQPIKEPHTMQEVYKEARNRIGDGEGGKALTPDSWKGLMEALGINYRSRKKRTEPARPGQIKSRIYFLQEITQQLAKDLLEYEKH